MNISRRDFLKSGVLFVLSKVLPYKESLEVLLAEETPSPTPSLDFPTPEDLFPVLKEALRRGGDFSDIYVESTIRRSINFEDGKIKEISYQVERGIGIRVLQDEGVGYAYVNGFDLKGAMEAAKTARRIAGEGKTLVVPIPKERKREKNVIPVLIPLETVSLKERIDLVMRAFEAAQNTGKEIEHVSVSYEETDKRIMILTSEGFFVRDHQPLIYLIVHAQARRGDKRHRGRRRFSEKAGFEQFNKKPPEEVAKEAAREAIRMLDARPCPAGVFPVIVERGWGGVLFHESVGHGLEADGIVLGSSYYTGKLGQRVASPLVTLLDDGTYPNGRGSFNFDDEGTPSQKTVLIDQGVLVSYMTDVKSARKLGMKRTGNGRRASYLYPPLVRMTNTYILKGETPRDDIFRATKKGLYAREFQGGQVDTSSGTFTFSVREAYWIENGEIAYPVEGATLVGKGPEVLKTIDLVGDDFDIGPGTCGKGQWVPVTTGQPTLRIGKITVGGRKA